MSFIFIHFLFKSKKARVEVQPKKESNCFNNIQYRGLVVLTLYLIIILIQLTKNNKRVKVLFMYHLM